MALIGLTGGIGSGKSTVANLLIEQDYVVIDTDKIAREVVKPETKTYKKIVDLFGPDILEDNSIEISRKKLGNLIFKEEKKRKLLNKIMHPIIKMEVCKKILFYYLKNEKIIFIDIPLLFETKLDFLFNKIIVVNCNREQQIERVIKRNDLHLDEVEERINSQLNLNIKCKMADYVIDNTKNIDDLYSQLSKILIEIKKSNLHKKQLYIFRLILFSSSLLVVWSIFLLFKYCKIFS